MGGGVQEFFTLWRLKRREGVLWITTVAATLVFGIINGARACVVCVVVSSCRVCRVCVVCY